MDYMQAIKKYNTEPDDELFYYKRITKKKYIESFINSKVEDDIKKICSLLLKRKIEDLSKVRKYAIVKADRILFRAQNEKEL